MYARRTATLATLLALAACGGSSTPQAQSKPPASSSPVAAGSSAPVSVASEAGLQAQPAPASFPDGEYARTVKLQGELDGRWRLTLRHDGRYELVSPQSKTSEGIYVVDQKQIIFTAPD